MSGTKAGINPGRLYSAPPKGAAKPARPVIGRADRPGGMRARQLSGFRLPLSGDQALLFFFAQWPARHEAVYRDIQGL